jgi:excisionase family DNA binding protein
MKATLSEESELLRPGLSADQLLTVREAASLLRCSVLTIKRFIYAGKLPASKMGGQWRIHKSDIFTLLEVNIFRVP